VLFLNGILAFQWKAFFWVTNSVRTWGEVRGTVVTKFKTSTRNILKKLRKVAMMLENKARVLEATTLDTMWLSAS
jgi:hypothetical protein